MSVADRLARSMPGCASEPLLDDPDFVQHMQQSILGESAWTAEERKILWRVPFSTIMLVACMVDEGVLGLGARRPP